MKQKTKVDPKELTKASTFIDTMPLFWNWRL